MRPMNDQRQLDELTAILAEIGPGSIWRPVHDHRGRCLASGVGDPADGLTDSLPDALFNGKRVVDIGCNFGTFTFMAASKGARHVLGIDVDQRVIRGCQILKKLYRAENVDFAAADVRSLDKNQPFDMAMMIDFIGKDIIRSGFLPICLDVIEALSNHQMLFSVRPVYNIAKHFDDDREKLLDFYSPDAVGAQQFLLLELLKRRFQDRWEMQIVSAERDDFNDKKQTVLFNRRH
jgi:ribosomal protein L11 methyltransferase